MKIKNLKDTLLEHPLFSSMSEKHITDLEECATLKVFRRDELLIKENEPANFFFLIRDGRVSVEISTAPFQNISLQILEKNDILGWSWIIDPYHYDFNARALELTRAIIFDGPALRERCDEDPSLGYDLLRRFTRVMTDRLKATRFQLLEMHKKLTQKS